MKQIHIERIKDLYAMLDGIPDQKVDLNWWNSEPRDKWKYERTGRALVLGLSSKKLVNECGMGACVGGWAAIYPKFVEQGLSRDEYGGAPKYRETLGFDAMSQFLGISYEESTRLFGVHGGSDQQRQVALKRLRDFMVEKKIITKKRANELAKSA